MLLQIVLSGKAPKTYAALLVGDYSDYDKVKLAILKNYELVPETRKFRNYKKSEGHSYLEFIKDKEGQFDKWCNSRNIGKEYDKAVDIDGGICELCSRWI